MLLVAHDVVEPARLAGRREPDPGLEAPRDGGPAEEGPQCAARRRVCQRVARFAVDVDIVRLCLF